MQFQVIDRQFLISHLDIIRTGPGITHITDLNGIDTVIQIAEQVFTIFI